MPSPEALMKNDLSKFVHFTAVDYGFDGSIEALVINWLHPLMLAAKASTTNIDNPNWRQAMNGPFSEEYWESACVEVQTLEKMKTWNVFRRDVTIHVLSSTWAFKGNCYPDELIKKLKAQLCARGDQ